MQRKLILFKILIMVSVIFAFIGAILLVNATTFGKIAKTIGTIAFGIGLVGSIVSICFYKSEESKNEVKQQVQREDELAQREKREQMKLQNLGEIIEKTKILSTSTVKDKSDAMKRGIIGALLIGTSGAVIGTATSGHIKTTTFLVVYKNGKKEAIEVVNGTPIYDLYLQALEV